MKKTWFNHQSSIINSQLGFTLVEMLAVMVVFLAVGSIVVGILVATLRTSNKTDVLTLVKQNGNYALSQIAKTIRDARGLTSPYPCYPTPQVSQSITVVDPGDNQIIYSCQNNTIASNSASLLDTSTVKTLTCSFTCTQQSTGGLPFITVAFSLVQQNTSSFIEQQASISGVPFQTSIVIRNINR